MALTDILNYEGVSDVMEMARGNIGTLVDIQSARLNEFKIPSGGGAGAVFPTVGNVDLGITYGPTGTDYTGTLVQPAITDVKSGVSYGAGGTEFTGTLSGGGGNIFVLCD